LNRRPIIAPDGTEIFPKRQWLWSKDRVKMALAKGEIAFLKDKEGNWSVNSKQYLRDEQGIIRQSKAFSIIEDVFTQHGTNEVLEIFGNAQIFSFPKPTTFVSKLLSIGTEKKEDHIVLDFFAGSGTTAQAVIELNEEDGGNRQFICVQMPEIVEADSEAFKAGYKTIADITKARISKVIEKISREREGKLELEAKQNLGFNAYKLAESNFKIWRSDIQGKDAILEQLRLFQSSEKSDSQQENMLTELLLKTGLGLGVQYLQEQSFYKVGNLWICFEKFQPEMKEQILQSNVQKVIFLNSCFSSDAELSNLQLELKENDINLVII